MLVRQPERAERKAHSRIDRSESELRFNALSSAAVEALSLPDKPRSSGGRVRSALHAGKAWIAIHRRARQSSRPPSSSSGSPRGTREAGDAERRGLVGFESLGGAIHVRDPRSGESASLPGPTVILCSLFEHGPYAPTLPWPALSFPALFYTPISCRDEKGERNDRISAWLRSKMGPSINMLYLRKGGGGGGSWRLCRS